MEQGQSCLLLINTLLNEDGRLVVRPSVSTAHSLTVLMYRDILYFLHANDITASRKNE